VNIELCKSQTIKLILILTLLSIISACATSPTTKLRKIPSSNATPKKILSKNLVDPDLTLFNCANVHIYEHTVVGDGHCVSLIKQCSGAPNTSHWRPGPLVNESDVAKGTIIATFQNGRYPNRTGYHAVTRTQRPGLLSEKDKFSLCSFNTAKTSARPRPLPGVVRL